jgi:hypothetical protein
VRLLKVTYGQGPLRAFRKVYSGGSGRPTYYIRGGWRCGNGAGGAACFNARRKSFNVVKVPYGDRRFSVTASVG